jgi:UDPglucose 6-dehydrogenase
MKLAGEPLDVAEGAHALVIMTEWQEFTKLTPTELRSRMAYPIIVDARNCIDAQAFAEAGFTVIGVGRPVVHPAATTG